MPRSSWFSVPGPLAEYVDGFRAELDRLGYTAGSREYKVNQVGRLSRWLAVQGLTASDLDQGRLAAFLTTMATSRRRPPAKAAMKPLLDFLHAQGVLAPAAAAPRGRLDELMDDYRRWMVGDRALAGRTIDRYEKTARRFLTGRAAVAGDGTGAEAVTAGAVMAFLLSEVSRTAIPTTDQGSRGGPSPLRRDHVGVAHEDGQPPRPPDRSIRTVNDAGDSPRPQPERRGRTGTGRRAATSESG
jgi:hypothetical protein